MAMLIAILDNHSIITNLIHRVDKMKTLNNNVVSTLRLQSGAEVGVGNNSPVNLVTGLDGFEYTVVNDTIVATKNGAEYLINPLATIARLALATVIKPEQLSSGQLLDKLICTELAAGTPYEFKTGSVSKKPLQGHHLTADEFEANSKTEFETIQGTKEHVYSVLASLSDKDSKAKILADIASLLGTIPAERLEAIAELRRKEEAVNFSMTELSTYLDNLTIKGEKTLVGVYKSTLTPAEQVTFSKLLVQEYDSYTILPKQAIMDGFTVTVPACVEVTVILK